MTDTQLLLLLGTIWIAPHMNELYSKVMGLIFVLVAVFINLGWL